MRCYRGKLGTRNSELETQNERQTQITINVELDGENRSRKKNDLEYDGGVENQKPKLP